MKKKNYNYRTCLITNKKFLKTNLIRICKIDNKLVVDYQQKMLGRGYYLSQEILVVSPLMIKKKLEQKTNLVIDNNLIDNLLCLAQEQRNQ